LPAGHEQNPWQKHIDEFQQERAGITGAYDLTHSEYLNRSGNEDKVAAICLL